MLQRTNGIVLRSIKYGDTSLVTTIFTAMYGVQTYMVQGVRSAKARQNRAGSFQPATLLDLVVYQQPNKNLQRIREFQVSCIYSTLQQEVVKNSIVLFSAEILLRLLPEHAPLPGLFNFVHDYFITLDKTPVNEIGNFPLYFIIHCGRDLGFDPKGSYSSQTPHLNLQEGGYTEHAPAVVPYMSEEDAIVMDQLLKAGDYESLKQINLNSDMRMRMTDWYITFLQQHTQHMGPVRSLSILRTVLH
jgi:DNA repair protein RecO (recombination protein O)